MANGDNGDESASLVLTTARGIHYAYKSVKRLLWPEETLQPPGRPNIMNVSHNQIMLGWPSVFKSGGKTDAKYLVKYKAVTQDKGGKYNDEGKWEEHRIEDNYATISNLQPNTEYVFGICIAREHAVGEMSEITPPTKTLPPSPPVRLAGKPNITNVSHDQVMLGWPSVFKSGDKADVKYLVKYKAVTQDKDGKYNDEGIWTEHQVEDNHATISNLQPNTEYVFGICIVEEYAVSEISEITPPIKTHPPSPPVRLAGKPNITNVSHDQIVLGWPSVLQSGDKTDVKYLVKYKAVTQDKGGKYNDEGIWKDYTTEDNHATIANLQPNTEYVFGICIIGEHAVSEISEITPLIKTLPIPPVRLAGKPNITNVSHNQIMLGWPSVLHSGDKTDVKYLVKYKAVTQDKDGKYNDEGIWKEHKTEDNHATISNLRPNTEYVFGICIAREHVVGEISERTPTTKTLPTSPPVKLAEKRTLRTSITITWRPPDVIGANLSIHKYKVSCSKSNNEKEVNVYKTETAISSFTLHSLNPGTLYKIRVSTLCKSGEESSFSDPIEIETAADQSQYLIESSNQVQAGNPAEGKVSIYKLPLREGHCSESHYRTYQVWETDKMRANDRVIMVVGATGAGKSTLVNGIINYIHKVEWGDNYRLKIIDEKGENQQEGQAHSQTQIITSYTINKRNESELNYALTIVDTPGFGDTRGIDRDKVIVEQVREFFTHTKGHGIDHINAICFVAQASQARLTPTQKYVFDSILALFGKDVAKNIMMLITFADGGTPKVMDAIKKANLPFLPENVFKFNNSALFARNSGTCEMGLSKLFWNMGEQSMMKFFAALHQAEERSLTLTQQVLEERMRLDATLQGLQQQIKLACNKMEELKKEQDILANNEAKIRDNTNFEYTVDVQKSRTIPIKDQFITNCANCHMTCHYPCRIPDDKRKMNCYAMEKSSNGDRVCRVCPGKCPWFLHFNQDYRFELYSEPETRTFLEMKERFQCTSEETVTLEQLVQKLEEEVISVQMVAFCLITEAQESLERLQEIALRPNPLSTVEYVDLLIQAEKNDAKDGWMKRVSALTQVRNEAKIMGKLINTKGDALAEFSELKGLNEEIRMKYMEKLLGSPLNPLDKYDSFKGNQREMGLFAKILTRFRTVRKIFVRI